jgi:hypothetical protein
MRMDFCPQCGLPKRATKPLCTQCRYAPSSRPCPRCGHRMHSRSTLCHDCRAELNRTGRVYPTNPIAFARRNIVLGLRLSGLTYADIGSRLTISRQRVQQLCRPPRSVIAIVRERAGGFCETCHAPTERGHIHHLTVTTSQIEEYHDPDNLRYLCLSCHRMAHDGEPRTYRRLLLAAHPEVHSPSDRVEAKA